MVVAWKALATSRRPLRHVRRRMRQEPVVASGTPAHVVGGSCGREPGWSKG